MEPFCKLLFWTILQLYCTAFYTTRIISKVACYISNFTLQGLFLHTPTHYNYIYSCIGLLISIHYVYSLSATAANLMELISFPPSELKLKMQLWKRHSKARGLGESGSVKPRGVEEADLLKKSCWRAYPLPFFNHNVKHCLRLVWFLCAFGFHKMQCGCEFGSWFIVYCLVMYPPSF